MNHEAGVGVGADKEDCAKQRSKKECGLIV